MEELEEQKIKLEIEKLQAEVNNRQYFLPRWLTFVAALLPTLFTVGSLFLTYHILTKNNVFTANNTFLAAEKENLNAQKENLKREIFNFQKDSTDLYNSLRDLRKTTKRQHDDSIRLSKEIQVAKNLLKSTLDSLKPEKRKFADIGINNIKLSTENQNLKDHINRLSHLTDLYTFTIQKANRALWVDDRGTLRDPVRREDLNRLINIMNDWADPIIIEINEAKKGN